MEEILLNENDMEWADAPFPNARLKVLKTDEKTGEITFLAKLDAGAELPAHKHPSSEAVYVLDGDIDFKDKTHVAGTYYYTPRGIEHGPFKSTKGCTLLCIFDGPME